MNVGQTGTLIYIYAGVDLTKATSITLTLNKPDQTTATVTPTIGSAVLTLPNGSTWAAGTYAYYSPVSGDIDQAGNWSLRLTYNGVGQVVPGQLAYFVVGP